jgi:hypothetical protein
MPLGQPVSHTPGTARLRLERIYWTPRRSASEQRQDWSYARSIAALHLNRPSLPLRVPLLGPRSSTADSRSSSSWSRLKRGLCMLGRLSLLRDLACEPAHHQPWIRGFHPDFLADDNIHCITERNDSYPPSHTGVSSRRVSGVDLTQRLGLDATNSALSRRQARCPPRYRLSYAARRPSFKGLKLASRRSSYHFSLGHHAALLLSRTHLLIITTRHWHC